MPSVSYGCTFTDQTAQALANFNLALADVEKAFDAQTATLAAAIADLSTAVGTASRTIGAAVNEQITWTALTSGVAGNDISITYLYAGPIFAGGILVPRVPAASVSGKAIFLWLGCDATGAISGTTAAHLAAWLAFPAVTALVTGTLVGTGLLTPSIQPLQHLAGGKDSPMPAAEAAAQDVARVFRKPDYLTMLRDLDVPVVTSDAEARALLNENDHYCIVNGKLFIIDGTNLTGMDKLWLLYLAASKVKTFVGGMKDYLPRLITTQNVTTTNYEIICGQQQAIVTVTEVLRDVDTAISVSAQHWGAYSTLKHYVFWDTRAKPSSRAYEMLRYWGFPEMYLGSILAGESPEALPGVQVTAPTCWVVEDRNLLSKLHLTDAEIAELLALQIPGVKIPSDTSPGEKAQALSGLQQCPPSRSNGARSAQRCGISAMRVIKPSDVFQESDLSNELATRGKACARLRADIPGFPAPPDLPNADFSSLPNPAKKIESAFAALSSAISSSNRMFDRMTDGMVKTVMGMLDKIQNLLSLADNLLKNPLVECLLGASTSATGMPEYGSAGGSSTPSISSLTGGLPIPMSALSASFDSMSKMLDQTITTAFELQMKQIEIPLCLVRAMLDSVSGISLGGLTNPCLQPPDNCPAEDVQAVIDASTSMTAAMSGLQNIEGLPTTLPVQTITESVQSFTGLAQKSMTESTSAVTRGIQGIMDDFQTSINAKTKLVTDFQQKVKELFAQIKSSSEELAEASTGQSKCGPPAMGPLMDQITQYL
jgi:hypothetical protein